MLKPPISNGRSHVKSRPTRSSLGLAIGVAVLLSVASPKLAFSDSTQTSESGAPTAESGAPTTQSGTPTKVVDALHENLISVMKDAETLGYDGRFDRLEPVISELFDIPFMAEKSIGRHWKTVDEESRAHLLTTFGRFTVANYAGRFTGYSGQTFETVKEQASRHGTVLVYSRLVPNNGDETIQLNYRLRPDKDDGWRIIDVLLNGTVSELALRRAEYSSLIQNEGFAALMSALNKRIDDFAGDKAPDKPS
jgi:phospholipid transport system substrate-binding protein